jgi:hypothetical protein
MNPVEIEEAVSNLAQEPFDRGEFPYQFLRAFGSKDTAIQRLKAGNTNQSDIAGGVLQRGNIHIATCAPGAVDDTLKALRESPRTVANKVKFVLATDGVEFQAEDMNDGGTVVCPYASFDDHFGFFLPLAGITTVAQIRESSFDIKATGRLNKLYVELLKDNPDWTSRREAMNHFMARLIFCFFAEDTDIFVGEGLFSKTIEQMSARDASDTHLVMAEIFRAMDTKPADREAAGVKRYANQFPYVNGQLFSGSTDCPRFSKIARSYLLHIGSLNWKKINPDIFGSMIQAVADDEERGALGMHYTSVPNILKVLNPLFLDDLRKALEDAGDNGRKLLNLRQRMAKIRVFDPACGSGNFLVIAYKEMRAIESEINRRRGEIERRSDIPLTNFRGIELRDFPAEIARLALIIAEYQCDVTYRGQKEALTEFLPLDSQNWITCGDALRLDWLSICPPTGTSVRVQANDLFETPLDQAEIDFRNEGGETYICGNPPYVGSKKQTPGQKEVLKSIFSHYTKLWKSLDYVSAWFFKAAHFSTNTVASCAFVAADGICQGQQASIIWPILNSFGVVINFAHTSFWWGNLASNNATVLVAIIGFSRDQTRDRFLFSSDDSGEPIKRQVLNINSYLIDGPDCYVSAKSSANGGLAVMQFGNHPYYGTALILSAADARHAIEENPLISKYLRSSYGSHEMISNSPRKCLWIRDIDAGEATKISTIAHLSTKVAEARRAAIKDSAAQKLSATPWRFRDQAEAKNSIIVVPRVSSCNRDFLPCGMITGDSIVTSEAFALNDADTYNFSVASSRMHLAWISAVCGKFGPSYRYSNTLGWNTFPIPTLTDQNKADLTRCAEDILLAREAHFPATIADLYDPDEMPEDLRAAHDRNDEVLERIYIGRRFRNDTERLEKLFEMYTKMTKGKAA